MLLDLLQDYFKTGRLPNTETATDPSQEFRLSEAEIDALSSGQLGLARQASRRCPLEPPHRGLPGRRCERLGQLPEKRC